jgi:hypothetical protein
VAGKETWAALKITNINCTIDDISNLSFFSTSTSGGGISYKYQNHLISETVFIYFETIIVNIV